MFAHQGNNSLSRLVAYLLVLCVVLSCLPVKTHSSAPESGAQSTPTTTEPETTQPDVFFDQVKIYANGEEATNFQLSRDSYLTLTAKYEGGHETADTYTWQIYNPLENSWVSINDTNSADLKAGAALLEGMTDENGVAILNCKIVSGGNLYYSNAISIQLLPQEETAAPQSTATKSPRSGIRVLADTPTAPTGDVSGGELVTYTVRVEYFNYITQKEAAKPYIATVKPNSASLTVFPDSPTVVGFTPYIITKGGIKGGPLLQNGEDGAKLVYEYTDENGVMQQIYGIETHKLELELGNVTADKTYQIVYMPNKVYYTVSHYVQNISRSTFITQH